MSLFAPLALAFISLITHFIFSGQPNQVVFDEVFNGKFLEAYGHGAFYFDVHPALGKLIMLVFGQIRGIPDGIDFSHIGNAIPSEIVFLRLLPMIAGTLLPILIYFICRNLNISIPGSFTAGVLMTLENSLIVQSRFILFDSFMLFFGFSSLLTYLIYRRYPDKSYLIWSSAMLSTGAFCIKWTGLAFPLLIFIMELARVKNVRTVVKFFIPYAIVSLVIYMSVFSVNFSLLSRSGEGDVFMSERFQKTLIGSQYENDSSIKPKGFFGKFFELNVKMVETDVTENAFASPWYTWPIMMRSLFYWQDFEAGRFIYLIGNPLIYWGGTLAMLILVGYSIRKKDLNKASLFIIAGYCANFLPFFFIHRPMFLYHYEAALIFSIMAIVFLMELLPKPSKIYLCLISLCFISFIFFSPITYGLPVSQEELNSRMWLSTWR